MATEFDLCVFDDDWQLPPLTATRPVLELRCGALRLWEKVALDFGQPVSLLVPERLAAVTSERNPGVAVNEPVAADRSTIFINGRALRARPLGQGPTAILDQGQVVTARLAGSAAARFAELVRSGVSPFEAIADRPTAEAPFQWIRHPWDLIVNNSTELGADFARLGGAAVLGDVHPSATLYRPEYIRIEAGATVEAGAVIDARHGTVWLGHGAVVHPLSYVQGPAAIGAGSYVMSGARVREGTSLGPVCRIGGEIEETIVSGYANKVHDGFVGHSYIGAWCNLGALTTTSDLKNTYGTVRMPAGSGTVDTGLTKLGSIIGDHVRLGIGTLLTSGAVIGPACNLFGGTLLPKEVKAFTWGSPDAFEPYDSERFFVTAETAMSRRGVTLGPAERALLKQLALRVQASVI